MQSIPSCGHDIHFNADGYQALNDYLADARHSTIFVLTDTNTDTHCAPRFLSLLTTGTPVEIIEVEPGESFKNISTCLELWQILTEMGADRKSLLINLGGGVITDIGGFVAATFKRGIAYINVPTSLLGMVDAAIGGKNGIDLDGLKNQVGTITSPKMVLVDTALLETLPRNEMRSGLAEMLKHGLIADAGYWAKFRDLAKIDYADFDGLIYESVRIKNDIVMEDLTENGIRKALNFGHTLGHAIESHFMRDAEKSPLLHGEAVAAGMILESYISWQKGLLPREGYYEIKYIVKSIFEDIDFNDSDTAAIVSLLAHDKKNEYGAVRFALLGGIGRVSIDQNVDNELIAQAFADYKL
jgi:3-dehydroquinate synthase